MKPKSLIEFARCIYPDLTLDWFQILLFELWDRCLQHDPLCDNVQAWFPTGYGKSWAIQLLAAWILAQNPSAKLMVGTNSDLLAREDAMGALAIMRTPQFAVHFYTPEFTQESAANFQLKQGGGLHAASLSGQQLGWRADAYLLDDPTRSIADAWAPGQAAKLRTQFQAALTTRLTPGAPIFLTAQRLKTDDLPGWLREQAYQNPLNKQWAILCLPMVATESQPAYLEYTRNKEKVLLRRYKTLASIAGTRFSFNEQQTLERIAAASANDIVSNAMLQQHPKADDESIWPMECWREIERIPSNEVQYITIGVDTAVKTGGTNDFSAWCVVVYGPQLGYVVTDYIETRVRTQQLVDITHGLWESVGQRYGVEPRLSIERAGSGEQLCNLLESQHPQIKFFESDNKSLHTNKRLRASGVSHFTDCGSVSVLASLRNKEHFIETMLNFGNPSWHDDLCDAYVWAMIPFAGDRGLRRKENMQTQQELQVLARWEEAAEIAEEVDYQRYMDARFGDLTF